MSAFDIGDLVVCVNAQPTHAFRCYTISRTLKKGRHYRVSAVLLSPSGHVAVLLDGEPAHARIVDGALNGWNPDRFRKIEPASPDFIEQIKPVSTPALGARTAEQEVLG